MQFKDFKEFPGLIPSDSRTQSSIVWDQAYCYNTENYKQALQKLTDHQYKQID